MAERNSLNQRERLGASRVMFASYAESDEQLIHICSLVESIRRFSGYFSASPVIICLSDTYEAPDHLIQRLSKLGAEILVTRVEDGTEWYYYSGKVSAASLAECAAEGRVRVLVWMDEDTVVLREPKMLDLGTATSLAYRPVMHNRSGSLYSQKPCPFWNRVYSLLGIDIESMFSVVTPADKQRIRAYFNAGLLSVRPDKGLLRGWLKAFIDLCRDTEIRSLCNSDAKWRIFLHQAALVGPIMLNLGRDEMVELPPTYNYPIFFRQMFGADEEFDDLSDVVTMRYDVYFRNADPEWATKLKGPSEVIDWLKSHLGS